MNNSLLKAEVTIRPASLKDAAEIAAVYLSSRKEYVSCAPLAHSDNSVRNWIKTLLVPAGNVMLALIKDEIVGLCVISVDDKASWIDHLYLKPGHLRKGIGAVLLTDALTKLSKPIRLYTFQENEGARRFYEHYGFAAITFGDGSGNEEKTADVLYELV
ncbi:MAG: GNAT superfamily N-acetyltransferase [Cellvibrionaceae bacterium]|jgi:GNAT superfamily N-acetyltransferase